MKRFGIRKMDIVLFVLLLAMGAGSLFIVQNNANEKSIVRVQVGNNVVEEKPLAIDVSFVVETENGFNKIEIQDKKVRVIDADCAGGDCMQAGWISKEGEALICAPHKLIVTIAGGTSEVDSIAY